LWRIYSLLTHFSFPPCFPDRTNRHPGNKFFRDAIDKRKDEYKVASTPERKKIVKAIVEEVNMQSPAGRFIERSRCTGRWRKVGFRKALEKTRQALTGSRRERRLARRNHQVSLLKLCRQREVVERNSNLTNHHFCPILRKT
jgi:hypothetical protein